MPSYCSGNDRLAPATAFSLRPVKTLFLDVVGEGGIDQLAQRSTGLGSLADGGGGNGVLQAIEEMDGYPGKQQIALGRMLLERLGGCALRTQGLGQGVGDLGQRVSGAAGNDERALCEQGQRLVPGL